MSWVIPDAILPFWSHADSARSVKRRGNKDGYIWTHPGPKLSQNNEYYECRSRNKHEMISLFLLKANVDLGVTNLRELTLPDHTLHPWSTVHRDMFIVWRSESIWCRHFHNFLREMIKDLNKHIIEMNLFSSYLFYSFILFTY